MTRQELQGFISELREINDNLKANENDVTYLIQLTNCLSKLKKDYPKYEKDVKDLLDTIEGYVDKLATIKAIKLKLTNLINKLTFEENKPEDANLFEAFKKIYKDAKDTIEKSVPEDVKLKYNNTKSKAEKVGAEFAEKVKQESPKYAEKFKNETNKFEKKLKTGIKNWLLSEDDEEK